MGKSNWQELINKINEGVEEERLILKKQLHHKIEELGDFKNEINTLKETTIEITKTREDRIRQLEKKLTDLQRCLAEEKAKNQNLDEELRITQMKNEQLEHEVNSLQQELKSKVNQINQLRMEILPQAGLTKKSQRFKKLDRIQEDIDETQQFFRQMSDRINRILRY